MGLLGLVHNTICGGDVMNTIRTTLQRAGQPIPSRASLAEISEQIALAYRNGNSAEAARLLGTVPGFSQYAGNAHTVLHRYVQTTQELIAGLSQTERLAMQQARNVGRTTNRSGARVIDCEQSVAELRRLLPGGERLGFSVGGGVDHVAYQYQGRVFDLAAGQYVRPGVWTAEALETAGLTRAVESGIFTPAQHSRFMEVVERTLASGL